MVRVPEAAWSLRWPNLPLAIGAFVLLGVGVHLFVRQDNEWERVFLPAAARLWTGDDLYRADGNYLYPPFTAWATLPFLALSHAASRLVFVSLNIAGVAYVLSGAWRLARLHQSFDGPEWRVAVAGACCGIFYLHNCLVHQQTDVWIAALLTGGCLALARERSLQAATAFGLAAAMKCTALLWVPYLVWRRKPGAAVWLLAVALGVNLLPDLVSRPASGRLWLGEFGVRYLRPLLERDHIAGSWGSQIVYNQSLAGAGQRWLMTVPHWSADDCTVERTTSAISPLTLRAIVQGSSLVLLLAAAWACGRPFRDGTGSQRDVLEYCVVLLLMLLLSPMSSAAHFGILIIPGFCLARRAVALRDRLLTALLLGACLAALASNKDLLGGRLYTLALWSGCVMWNALFLLAGCLRELTCTQATVSAANDLQCAGRFRPPEARRVAVAGVVAVE